MPASASAIGREHAMARTGLSREGLARRHEVLSRHVESGEVPGLVAVVARGDEVHVDAIGAMEPDGPQPVAEDTIFRISSMTKPIVAVAALTLLEDCRLRLDDPVDEHLPELADRRVLVDPAGPLDRTVAAERPITTRDLLTFTSGYAPAFTVPADSPYARAMTDPAICTGPPAPGANVEPDDWLRRMGEIPLVHQPGRGWRYHVSADLLGTLIARASGQTLDAFVRERVLEPLGMVDTAFSADRALDRFGAAYDVAPDGDGLVVWDPRDGQWSAAPSFPSGGGGMVSTALDYLRFARMLRDGGRGPAGDRILSPPSVALMTGDRLTAEQKANADFVLGDDGAETWGFGVGVVARRTGLPTVGTYGWTGGLGSLWANDPATDLTFLVLTNRVWSSPVPPAVAADAITSAYAAVD
jgi:CubicO group peptidase (beta-lactamase class C family)